MNDAFSFSISIGIIAFGIWIAAGTIRRWLAFGLDFAFSPSSVIVGTISLYLAVREVRVAPRN